MRIQYELTKEQERILEKLKAETGIKRMTEFLNNALTLFEWAINERKSGNIIGSVDRKEKRFRQVILPALSAVSPSEG